LEIFPSEFTNYEKSIIDGLYENNRAPAYDLEQPVNI
jgi:hypothetical protein